MDELFAAWPTDGWLSSSPCLITGRCTTRNVVIQNSVTRHAVPLDLNRSYNNSVGRNGSGLCRDATMPRDSQAGLIETMFQRARNFASRALPKIHRTVDPPHALKIPARRADCS
jgi:hypothetical protein